MVRHLLLVYKVKGRDGDGILLFCVHCVCVGVRVQFYYSDSKVRKFVKDAG